MHHIVSNIKKTILCIIWLWIQTPRPRAYLSLSLSLSLFSFSLTLSLSIYLSIYLSAYTDYRFFPGPKTNCRGQFALYSRFPRKIGRLCCLFFCAWVGIFNLLRGFFIHWFQRTHFQMHSLISYPLDWHSYRFIVFFAASNPCKLLCMSVCMYDHPYMTAQSAPDRSLDHLSVVISGDVITFKTT